MAKRTPLYEIHKTAGAKFTEFCGWEMPVLYSSIVQEHSAVRKSAGIFDISHMGQIFVKGDSALAFLQKICTNDISVCAPSQAVYSHLCNERGGVIDDIFVYCLTQNHYLVIVNAATSDKDYRWMLKNKIGSIEINNKSDALGMAALQGPASEKIASKLFSRVPGRHEVSQERFLDETIFICRTGYTGEDGFEIVTSNGKITRMWELILEAGKTLEIPVVPCGLGARDTLRMEMGYLLYGQDTDDDRTPLEAGLNWVVKFNKGDFVGKQALLEQKNNGVKSKLTAFKLTERGIPRHFSKIFCNGKEIGAVTSGTFSPSIQTGIAMGYIPTDTEGSFSIECHSKPVPAVKTKLPFYSKK